MEEQKQKEQIAINEQRKKEVEIQIQKELEELNRQYEEMAELKKIRRG